MKKYISASIGTFVVHLFLYIYLFSVGTLKVSEGNSLSWFIPTIAISAVSLLIDLPLLHLSGWLAFILFKNKIHKNWAYVLLFTVVIGTLSLYFQVLTVNKLFNVISTIKPIAFLVLGFITITTSSLFFNFQNSRKKVEAIVFGNKEKHRDFVESFGSAVLVSDLDEFKKACSSYTAETHLIVDASEGDMEQIMALLVMERSSIIYLYTSETEPSFKDQNLDNWSGSFSFAITKFSEFQMSMMFRRIARSAFR